MPSSARLLPVTVFALVLAALLPLNAAGQAPAPTPQDTSSAPPAARQMPLDTKFSPGSFNLSVTGGTGLIFAISPYTLAPGKVAAGGQVLNFDRNPGDVDFFDYGFQLAAGLPGRTEVFFRVSPVLRTNSVGQDPPGYPFPPLDLFIDTYPTPAVRQGPVFLFPQEVPFKSYYYPGVTIDPPGHGAFAQSSGSVVVGGKVNLLSEDRHDRLGFGLRAYLDVPTESPKPNTDRIRAGVSGKVDVGFDLAASKRFRATELMLNLGYRKVGDPDLGVRIQLVDSSKTDPAGFLVSPAYEEKLDLHDRLSFNAGAAFTPFSILRQPLWVLTEFGHTHYVGHGTQVERLVHPAEVRMGLQMNVPGFKALAIGAAFQLLLNGGGDGELRTTNLHTPNGNGDINFSEMVDAGAFNQVSAFLAGRGATFSPNSSRVFSTNNPAFDQWRTISTAPTTVIAQGNGNILGFITWRIN